MCLQDLPGWPPVWATDYTEHKRLAVADRAIIQEVEPRPRGMLLITVTSHARTVTGVLPVPAELILRVAAIVQAHRGRPLSEAAEAEITPA